MLTLWFSAQANSVNGAYRTKAEASANTDWKAVSTYGDGAEFSTGHIFSLIFDGEKCIDGNAWLNLSNNTVELYGMGKTILNLPKA